MDSPLSIIAINRDYKILFEKKDNTITQEKAAFQKQLYEIVKN